MTKPELRKDIEELVIFARQHNQIGNVGWNKTIDTIFQKIDTYCLGVIGEDEKFTNIQMVDGGGKPTSKLYEEVFTLHMVTRNHLRAQQRASVDRGGK